MKQIWKTAALFAADLPAITMDGTTFRYHYADLADMPLMPEKPAGAWDDTAWNDENKFRGGTMAQAIKLARDGWPEGAVEARKLHSGIVASLPERRRLARYGVAGAVPNVARALAGNPMHMRQMALRETNERPIVTLVCGIGVSASFPAAAMLRHAAAVAAIVDLLESAEFRCEVLVAARLDGRVNAEIAIRLKAPEQPLNLAVMAFALGHPSMFRRHMFAILQADPDMRPLGTGLGYARKVPAAPERGTFTIGAANQQDEDATPLARFYAILAELALQGCPGTLDVIRHAA